MHKNNRGDKLVQYSLANLNQHGWPLVKLNTFQSTDEEFLYMLRRSDVMVRDPMDAIVMPKKWHHLCIAVDGVSNTVRGVSVSMAEYLPVTCSLLLRGWVFFGGFYGEKFLCSRRRTNRAKGSKIGLRLPGSGETPQYRHFSSWWLVGSFFYHDRSCRQ